MRWSRRQIINNLTSGLTWVLSSALTSHTHTLSSFLYITTVFHLASLWLLDCVCVFSVVLMWVKPWWIKFQYKKIYTNNNNHNNKIWHYPLYIIQIYDWIAEYLCATVIAPAWTVEDGIWLPQEARVRVKYFQFWDLLCSEIEWKFIVLQFCYNFFFF